MKRSAASFFCLLLAALPAAGNAAAPERHSPPPPPPRASQPTPPDLDRSIRSAREHIPGRVISAERRRENGRVVDHVRILTPDGYARRFVIDAETGEILYPPPVKRR